MLKFVLRTLYSVFHTLSVLVEVTFPKMEERRIERAQGGLSQRYEHTLSGTVYQMTVMLVLFVVVSEAINRNVLHLPKVRRVARGGVDTTRWT